MKKDVSLLALSRAASEESKILLGRKLIFQWVIFIFGCIALFIPPQYHLISYFFLCITFICTISAWFIDQYAKFIHQNAETARRRAMLICALGQTSEVLDVVDIRSMFSEKIEKKAWKLEDTEYYSNKQECGKEKLCAHLQECAFWSKHLYERAAWRAMRWFALMVILVVIGLIAIPFLGEGINFTIAQAFILFLIFLLSVDALGNGISWYKTAKQIDAIDRRLDKECVPTDIEPLLANFTDYSVATASSLPIPSIVYNQMKDTLNKRWDERQINKIKN